MSDLRNKVFDAIDEVDDVHEWYAKRMRIVRDYIFQLEAYISELEQDYDEQCKK